MKKIFALFTVVMMILSLAACGSEKSPDSGKDANQPEVSYNENTDIKDLFGKLTEESKEKEETEQPNSTSEEETQISSENKSDSEKLTGEIRSEFKEAMDSYEAFYDEYCDFMKKYSENPTDLSLLAKYAEMAKKLSDMDEKFKAWENEDLNSEELKYYIEVNGRISEKILEIAS